MGDVLIVFFFSSRRRHTRSLCDWSSDVCSSDLQSATGRRTQMTGALTVLGIVVVLVILAAVMGIATFNGLVGRSEERRVGKEWRSRWAGWQDKSTEWGRC